jgi:hypothetical protein
MQNVGRNNSPSPGGMGLGEGGVGRRLWPLSLAGTEAPPPENVHPTPALPHQGGGKYKVLLLSDVSAYLGFLGGAGASTLHMVPDSLQAGHFLGLQRVSTLLPHFSHVKTAMAYLLISMNHPLSPHPGRMGLGTLPGQCELGGHIIMNNTRFRQEMFKGTAGRALRFKISEFREGLGFTSSRGIRPGRLTRRKRKSPLAPALPANSPAPSFIPGCAQRSKNSSLSLGEHPRVGST